MDSDVCDKLEMLHSSQYRNFQFVATNSSLSPQLLKCMFTNNIGKPFNNLLIGF